MLEVIYICRHGFRSNWVTDNNGNYSAAITSPTGIPSDPPLASHGTDQAQELAAHVVKLEPKVERIISSPFYRCLQTIEPIAESMDLSILADNGVGEWYGVARFDHPSPASPELLHKFFPRLITSYDPTIIPSSRGETLVEIHDRTAYALAKIISDIDREWTETGKGPRAILICTHAATNIAAGRALTGDQDLEVRTGTCSLGTYRRRINSPPATVIPAPTDEVPIPDTNWRGNGVGGGWDMIVNGDCSFLKDGEERNWFFSGDESWDFPLVEGAQSNATVPVGGPGSGPAVGSIEKLEEQAKI